MSQKIDLHNDEQSKPRLEGVDRGVVLQQVLVGIVILVFWEIGGRSQDVAWFSQPSLIAARIAQMLGNDLHIHFVITLSEMLLGLGIGTVLGAAVGLLLGRLPTLSIIFRPIIFALYSIPLMPLAPVFIMFFGVGMLPKIVLVAIVVFFLLFFSAFAGVTGVDRDLVDTATLMGANRLEEFQKVILPASAVWIISGLKVATMYALVATITGEMLAAQGGLGFLLAQAGDRFDTTGLWSVLFILMTVGLTLNELTNRLEHWALKWRYTLG